MHLEAQPLLLQANLAVDARPPLGLLEANLILADAALFLFLRASDAVLFLANLALLGLADGSLGGQLGGPIGLEARVGLILFLLDTPVLDATELFQRKEDGVLTTLGHGCPFQLHSKNESDQ